MERIDLYPTDTIAGYGVRAGRPFPFGATYVPGGINFSIYSRHATACTLVLYRRGEDAPCAEIPIPTEFRAGNVWAVIVFDLDVELTEYAFRMDGPYDPRNGHYFNYENRLLDPYAKAITGRDVWGEGEGQPLRSRIIYDDFDWQHDRQLRCPIEELVIYEMHVRSFTRHPSSGVRYPGTFAALREKIPYLLELGVNAVELMPIFEFDEFINPRHNPLTGERLYDYWGYNTIGFFAPKAGYAATGVLGMQVDELKALIKELHRHGIEVILDVVFNHTGEGGVDSPTISFRGIDNKTYYLLGPEGQYLNFSGTGNTTNANHPVVRQMVLDCLRYWVAEYHIDGFRFDLASILGRDQQGQPLANPPLIEMLAHDPILADCKLIAEAWDAGGLYQVGAFPDYGRWAEWNGQYRDTIRRWLKGDSGMVGAVALRIQGSPDLYGHRGPTASINFITAHDGFTLHDLFAYNHKHNEANGEDNRDGMDENFSWNCGVEGETDNPDVLRLRARMMRNAVAILLTSHGVPMLLMGDEAARTKRGNNNTYCHDNELNWLDWSLWEQHGDLFRFFKNMIAFRKAHPLLRQPDFISGGECGMGQTALSWHGVLPYQPDWGDYVRTLAFMLCGAGGDGWQEYIYVAMNMHWDAHVFELPRLPNYMKWHRFADTFLLPPDDICEVGDEVGLENQARYEVGARSVVILLGK